VSAKNHLQHKISFHFGTFKHYYKTKQKQTTSLSSDQHCSKADMKKDVCNWIDYVKAQQIIRDAPILTRIKISNAW